MKASEAYIEGKFNLCQFNNGVITLIDNVNNLRGTFSAIFDTNNVILQVLQDSDMAAGWVTPAPFIPPAPAVISFSKPRPNLLRRLFKGGKHGK
jgi:hypothetical protein